MIWPSRLLIDQYERRIAELKSSHAEELSRVITQYDKLQAEYQRLVRVMHPSVQSITLPGEEKEEPKQTAPVFGGSRWEQFKAQKIWEQDQAAERANEKDRELKAVEDKHGSV